MRSEILLNLNQSSLDSYFSIGIIGENYTNFDLFRLIRKSNITNKINLPSEYSLSLSELDESIENILNPSLTN